MPCKFIKEGGVKFLNRKSNIISLSNKKVNVWRKNIQQKQLFLGGKHKKKYRYKYVARLLKLGQYFGDDFAIDKGVLNNEKGK